MYEVIKNVILGKRFELADVLKKIDTIWLQGSITDDQRTELVNLARENAVPENSYADLQKQVTTLFGNCSELAAEIVILKKEVAVLKGESVEPEKEVDEYPEYVQPTGAHDAYKTGAKLTFKGKKYVCIAPEGVAVVWDPDTMPSYYQEVTE